MLKIAHVALSVSDLDKSVAFYSRNFGLKPGRRFRIRHSGLKICILKKADVALELFHFKDYLPLPEYRKYLTTDLKTLGTKHPAFSVSNIERAYNKLKKSKVKFATDICSFENGLRYFFIKDPDGILVEVMEEKNR
jgi:glyoxylase I family protein